MIWVWIHRWLLVCVRMVLPPPGGKDPFSKISPEARCTACGNRGGTLTYERMQSGTEPLTQGGRPAIRWTCRTCKFSCYEEVVSYHKNPAV